MGGFFMHGFTITRLKLLYQSPAKRIPEMNTITGFNSSHYGEDDIDNPDNGAHSREECYLSKVPMPAIEHTLPA
jgi:hypothetical protein